MDEAVVDADREEWRCARVGTDSVDEAVVDADREEWRCARVGTDWDA